MAILNVIGRPIRTGLAPATVSVDTSQRSITVMAGDRTFFGLDRRLIQELVNAKCKAISKWIKAPVKQTLNVPEMTLLRDCGSLQVVYGCRASAIRDAEGWL